MADDVMPVKRSTMVTETYRIFIRDFVTPVRIGVRDRERRAPQRVRINVELTVDRPDGPFPEDISAVLSYSDIMAGLRALAGGGHVDLLENLADRIGEVCLTDPRVRRASVRVEKMDIYGDVAGIGVAVDYGR